MALALNPNRGIRHIERDTHRLEPIDPKDKWKNMSRTTHLLLILLSLVVDDVVEAELVDTLGGGDDAEPVTELLLLEVLLGPVKREKKRSSADRVQVSRILILKSDKTYRYLR
jgi:hypothetical protein